MNIDGFSPKSLKSQQGGKQYGEKTFWKIGGIHDDSGCTCDDKNGNECDCCQDIPTLKTSICLQTTWDATNQSLTAKATFGGINVGEATFSKNQTQQCISILGGTMCIVAANLSIVDTGACGCWEIDVNFFGVKVEVQLGCYIFGYGAECPGYDCTSFNSCQICDLQISCGWCKSLNKCLGGNNNGPFPPYNNSCTDWEKDSQNCSQ